MRLVWATLITFASGIAYADTGWSEFGNGHPLERAVAIEETACELDVTLHGAIAQVEERMRITNPGHNSYGAVTELELPLGAQLVALEIKHGKATRAETARAVATGFKTERTTSEDVIAPDPALVTALPPGNGRERFRLIVQPLAFGLEATITTRWTAIAQITGGALRLTLPGRAGKPCRGTITAKPGPGATVARVRVAGKESKARTFSLEANDLTLDVDLAFKRNEPLMWTQSESLGDNLTAQAITIVTPPGRAVGAKRVLFVIDSSRSMELIGRHRVKQVVRALAGMLTRGTEIDAILYDRTAQRVLGSWKTIDATQVAAIETAIETRTAGNGSDTEAALALAQQAVGLTRGETEIVLVTDGVMGQDTNLVAALAKMQVSLHAVVLSHDQMGTPDLTQIHHAIYRVGGSYHALDVDELDTALASLDDWLRPAWLELSLNDGLGWDADTRPPEQLRAGAGVVLTLIAQRPRKPVLTGHRDKPFKVSSATAPSAPVAELALASESLSSVAGPMLATLRARHPAVDSERAFAVLATSGSVAKSRREMIAKGGPFTRMVAIDDPKFRPEARVATARTGGSAIDRDTLKLLFRTQLQPAAFACYQRALAKSPKLAGTAIFELEIGRGETTRAKVSGLGDATFDACLLDAAYLVTPSLPNPKYNIDDRTLANYPLTFQVREQKPFVIAGDADSSSPLDIDAIQGGVPVRIRAEDTSTPLGNLRPSRNP
ncbi:MAG TPA: VWA domain-containing protein [Kofleriaceae bacterium]